MSKNKEHKQTDGILVNRLNFKVNEVEFNKRYTILHAEYGKYEIRKEAVRHLSTFHTVKAIRYEYGGTSFYILLDGNSEKEKIIQDLKKIVLNNPVNEENYSQVAPDIVFELLLIGLSYNDSDKEDDGDNLSYSNLDGGVYTFEPGDIYKGDRVVTFNLKARPAKDCVELFGETQLMFPAQTFATIAKMNEKEADRKYLKDLPRFQMVDNTYMKLSSKGVKFGSGVEYVKHGYRGMNKASIDFLGISSVDEFDKSKMGRTRLTLRKMRREYADIGLEVEFVRTTLFDGNKYTKKNPGFTKYLTELWSDKKINVVDKVKSPTSESIVKGVSMELKVLFNVDTVPSEDVVKGEYNIVVISKKIRDPNHKAYDDAMVQHISVESFAKKYHRKDPASLKALHEEIQSGKIPGNRRNSLEMWLSEFIIKGDIINNTQTFFGWYKEHLMNVEPVSTLDRTWRFYDRVRIENPDPENRKEAKYSDKMGCLEMNPNGDMSYRILEEAEVKEEFGLQLIWNQFNRNQSNIKGVMSDGENTYAFLSTDVKMIPELDSIRQKLRDNEKNHADDKSVSLTGGIKTKSDYELYLKACTDVRYAYVKNECYYFVGVRSEDIKFGLYWSAGLLKIKTLEGREKIPEVVFDMMLVPFVRLNRFTIVPYPFKYLREFEKTKGLENYIPEEPSEEETGKDSEHQWTLDEFGLI
ncbi:hypothetical protein [Methanomicrobium mobile]|uniref:hypothetical protein n=1 Tax=Methanomicrobium mobile TaxID=2205 RepID=UPI0005B28243|nr:hypothetical protein [Methanomicrobium mobile]